MMSDFSLGGEFVWHPTPSYIDGSHLQRFMTAHGIKTLPELQTRSVQDIAWYWETILDYLGIEFFAPYDQILDLSGGKPWPRWCVHGKLNIVHNCLDRWMGTAQQNVAALRWEGEQGEVRVLTYGDLHREVNRVANALRSLGLARGDAIGLYMPMTPEIAIALLAIAKIGGIILPLFSGYGSGAIATRLRDAEAKALFCADGGYRRGRTLNMKRTADEALSQVPSVEHVIVHRRTGADVPWNPGRDHWWDELVAIQPATAKTECTEAEKTLMIIYTSGTSGRPKGTIHTHCGFPIKAAHDLAMCIDLRPDDVLYWMTDMGWMMGPWEVFGTLILGGTMVFFDGAPDYPGTDRLWKLVENHGISKLGVSPTLIRALMVHGEGPVKRHDLSSLRAFASTGEPWNPDPWMWLFQVVGESERPILNYTGGTEIGGGIISGNVHTAVKPAAFSGMIPGMDADVVDSTGNPIRGQVGELVIYQPWLGMTKGFWKDPDRYIESYWSTFPDMWVHGDFTVIDGDGQWYILGRSDDTIKVGGKRLGPAEIESILVSHDAVIEAGVIGIPDDLKGSALVGFVVLKPGIEATEPLANVLKELVTSNMGKALKPKGIVFVPGLPKTRNAKVMRRVIRAAYLDQPIGDLSALVNPQVLETIRELGIQGRL
ncbi:MAG: AMP-binding protein [Chloroflexi bacterium]|nr:AMP-binding protein [Chloroflexota bacterium]